MNAPATGGPTTSSHHQGDRRRQPLGLRRHLGLFGHHPDLARLVGVGAAVALLSACGSTGAGGGNSSSTGSTVKVGTATVKGSSEQVLSLSDGYTLYYNTDDTSTTASCTGACAGTWPPLLLASGQPTSASSLSGTLTTASTGNGSQVEYDGHPLYRYSGDSGADQSNGEGIGGIWFVATPALGTSSSSTASPSAASAPNGY
jgi:predicted lipoprotein with Yx(FWY)xxD motif